MAEPETAEEPSMEDILASIRRIISDDEETGEAAAETTQEAEVAEPEAQANQVDFDAIGEEDAEEDNDQSSIDDIFELTEVVEEEASDEPLGQDAVDEISFDNIGDEAEEEEVKEEAADLDFIDTEVEAAEAEPEPEPAPEPEPMPEVQMDNLDPVADGDALLSDGAQASASAAFGALASTMLSHTGGARTLEELVQDMLRPMLKGWLDENLPPLVEKLVREEIERVARRGS